MPLQILLLPMQKQKSRPFAIPSLQECLAFHVTELMGDIRSCATFFKAWALGASEYAGKVKATKKKTENDLSKIALDKNQTNLLQQKSIDLTLATKKKLLVAECKHSYNGKGGNLMSFLT